MKNFKFFLNEFFDYVTNFLDFKLFKNHFHVFFNSIDQYTSINSDQKRCLETFVVQKPLGFIPLYFETQIRIFCNFFHDIVNDFYIKAENRTFFLEKCFDFVLNFVRKCMKNINFSFFEERFSKFKNSSSFIKVINEKYIEHCNKKYAN